MPTVKLTISKKFDRNEKENLALELTALVAKEIGKPETVTQAIVADDAIVSFGGNFLAPSAFIVVMSVGGLNPEVCKRLSSALCTWSESSSLVSWRRVCPLLTWSPSATEIEDTVPATSAVTVSSPA